MTTKKLLQLINGLEHKGHVLYCDNNYSSPELFLNYVHWELERVKLYTQTEELSRHF